MPVKYSYDHPKNMNGETMDELEELKRNVEFLDEIEGEDLQKDEPTAPGFAADTNQTNKLSPPQRFIISLLLFLAILIFGFFIMLVSGKMVLPF